MPRVKTVGRAKWRSAQTEYLSKADDQSQIGYPPFALEEIFQPLCLLLAGLRPPAPNPRSPSGGHLRPSQADPQETLMA